MRTFKKIVLSVILAAASFTVAAEATGEAKVRAALEGTLAQIQQAIDMTNQGADAAKISAVIGDARQSQKEFRFEGTERQRQKANEKMKVAREAIDKGENAAAELQLKEALADFNAMKADYDKTHK